MEIFRFRNFGVYKDAKKFRKLVHRYLEKFPSEERYILRDQISRAALSIVLNIAEGSAKSSDKEFRRFLGIAISSMSEVVAGFDLASDDGIINVQDFQEIEIAAQSVARQLGGFMKKLASDVRHSSIVKSHSSIVRGHAAR